MGINMDHPPAVFSTMADPLAASVDALQASFDVLQEALVYLSSTIGCEQDPTLFEFMSHSWDLPLGAPLHAILLASVLRQHVQMPCCLDTEPHFLADF